LLYALKYVCLDKDENQKKKEVPHYDHLNKVYGRLIHCLDLKKWALFSENIILFANSNYSTHSNLHLTTKELAPMPLVKL